MRENLCTTARAGHAGSRGAAPATRSLNPRCAVPLSQNCGTVRFMNTNDATNALGSMNGYLLLGRQLEVRDDAPPVRPDPPSPALLTS